LSINAIARLLNERQIPTRSAKTRWERSTVWGILRNPAYAGKACFGKTELRPRQRITRPLRQRNRISSRNSANHERPRQDWIEIPVPALVNETTFALAQEQLEKNKHQCRRRTVDPILLGGMLVCQQCGYALYRVSTHPSKHKLNYYRCIGSDGYRHLRGPVCRNRPIRQDYLDEFVWREVIRLLDDPLLIQGEIDRRMEAARTADPLRKREQSLRQQHTRLENNIARLVTAYQEELITLTELRQRIPNLRKQQQAVESQLHSLEVASEDQSRYLRLAETLSEFRGRLRIRAETLDVIERQKILRLVVQEIIVGTDTIRIRHSIPVADSGSGPSSSSPTLPTNTAAGVQNENYLLRTWSHQSAVSESVSALCVRCVFPHLPFERYADDAIVHCRTRREAEEVRNAVAQRLQECRLELHPEKTKIVYCKDEDRRGNDPSQKFDFLGYTFRPRKSKTRWGKLFVNFTPAISTSAAKAIRDEIRGWRLQSCSDKSIEDLSRMFNPIIRGWLHYYGRFYRS